MFEIDDYNQSVDINNQKIIFNLTGLDLNIKHHKHLFKSRQELVDSIKILYRKCENDGLILDKHIEQNMKFIKPTDNNILYCRTVNFNNGRQKSHNSTMLNYIAILESGVITPGKAIPFDLYLIESQECKEQSINDCVLMISDIKLKIKLKNNWYLSFILSKNWCSTTVHPSLLSKFQVSDKYQSKTLNIHKLKEIKSKLLNSEFTLDNFITDAPYDYADSIGIQLEFINFSISKKYFTSCDIFEAIKFFENGLIDTCKIGPQDIYVNVANILKLPNEAKYKTGEHGIKQLTSRVVTLDHDILHRELIPYFNSYAISEKTDGITSVVMIIGKDLYVTCGTIVYKFDILNYPTLPAQKNMDALKLNKMDFNNTWIFDAEIIINQDSTIILIPFDIRMAESINLDNVNFKCRLMFINGLDDLKVNKVTIKVKKWYKSSNIQLLYDNVKKNANVSNMSTIKSDGFIFSYLDSLNFTISMYYASKTWKWKPMLNNNTDNNTIDFLIQKCPDSLKGKFPYISGGRNLYVLCNGLNRSTHQSLPNITVIQSIIPNTALDYIPALFSPSDRPFSHLFWSDNAMLHNEIGEFTWSVNEKSWNLIKIRSDRRVEVDRGNYFGNDHKIAEYNWFMMNNPIQLDEINAANCYNNPYAHKTKFMNAIYEALVKHVLFNTETILNISPVTIMEPFNKFVSVVYVYKNKIEANRYIKDRYELQRKKIRFNSYYLLLNDIHDIKTTINASSIPISNNGFDNIILVYSILSNPELSIKSLGQALEFVEFYDSLISKNGKIIIVMREPVSEMEHLFSAFTLMKYRKAFDVPVSKWVYITDNELYDISRILVFTKAISSELVNLVFP